MVDSINVFVSGDSLSDCLGFSRSTAFNHATELGPLKRFSDGLVWADFARAQWTGLSYQIQSNIGEKTVESSWRDVLRNKRALQAKHFFRIEKQSLTKLDNSKHNWSNFSVGGAIGSTLKSAGIKHRLLSGAVVFNPSNFKEQTIKYKKLKNLQQLNNTIGVFWFGANDIVTWVSNLARLSEKEVENKVNEYIQLIKEFVSQNNEFKFVIIPTIPKTSLAPDFSKNGPRYKDSALADKFVDHWNSIILSSFKDSRFLSSGSGDAKVVYKVLDVQYIMTIVQEITARYLNWESRFDGKIFHLPKRDQITDILIPIAEKAFSTLFFNLNNFYRQGFTLSELSNYLNINTDIRNDLNNILFEYLYEFQRICQNGQDKIPAFFDGTHPSQIVHAFIASFMLSEIYNLTNPKTLMLG